MNESSSFYFAGKIFAGFCSPQSFKFSRQLKPSWDENSPTNKPGFKTNTWEGGGGVLKGFWLCHDKNYLIPYKALWYSYEQHPHLHYPSILCWRQLISPSVIPTTLPPPPPPHTHTRTILHLLLGRLRLYDWSLIRDYNFSNLQEITFKKVSYPIHVTQY